MDVIGTCTTAPARTPPPSVTPVFTVSGFAAGAVARSVATPATSAAVSDRSLRRRERVFRAFGFSPSDDDARQDGISRPRKRQGRGVPIAAHH
jgi:hypothetical protein